MLPCPPKRRVLGRFQNRIPSNMATETSTPASVPSDSPPALDPTVLLINSKEVARRLSISGRTWYVLVATHHAPQAIRLGKRTLWRVEELEEWVRDGCPPLERWQRIKDLPLRVPAKPPRKRASVSGT